MQIPEQYGKMKEPRRYREQKKENNTEAVGFFESISGKHVECHLVTGEVLEGILRANSYNKFDVEIENGKEAFLVRKDVISFIRCKS